jgi:hypothetical protein
MEPCTPQHFLVLAHAHLAACANIILNSWKEELHEQLWENKDHGIPFRAGIYQKGITIGDILALFSMLSLQPRLQFMRQAD